MRMIILLLLVLSSCSGSMYNSIQRIPAVHLSESLSDSMSTTILVFLDIDCPISQYVIKPLNAIQTGNKNQVQIVGVIPGTYYSAQEMTDFVAEYDIEFSVLNDEKMALVKKLNATITPEVFLVNEAGTIVYQGAVDDKFAKLGKSKPLVGTSYLNAALNQHLQGLVVDVPATEAIGCIIEK